MWLRLVLITLAFTLGHAVSAQDDLHMTVITGAGGTVRAGAAAPVHVLIRNSGPAISGVVVLNWFDSLPSRVTEFRTVELPQNSAKRITLYSEPGIWTTEIRVTLREYDPADDPRSGRKLAEFREPVAVLDAETPVLGIVGPGYSGLPHPTSDEGEPRLTRYYFPQEHLPDDPAGWEMCDAVLYTPATDFAPSAPELRALRDYVFLGGDLVVHASEPSAVFGSPGFADFMPYIPSGQEQRTIASFGGPVIHSVGRVEHGEVLLSDGVTPLVIQRNYGLGSVTAIAFDLSAPAFSGYSEAQLLWRRILPDLYHVPPDEAMIYEAKFDSFTQRVTSAVTRTPDVRVQLFVVVLLIGLYALAVGPGDYLLARRFKRPMLTWITFPSMVLIFTSMAFLGARVWVGGQEELHGHRTVTWLPEGALYNEALGYFASVTDSYTIGTEDGEAVRLVAHSSDSPDTTIINNGTGERLQRIPTWTARTFTRTYIRSSNAPVTFNIERRDATHVVTVHNGGDVPIRPAALFADSLHFVIREDEAEVIPPGGRGEVTLAMSRGSTERGGASTHGLAEIWQPASTRAPRYRSWDHRALANRKNQVLSYTVVDPEPLTLSIEHESVAAHSTTEVHHVVQRQPSNPEDEIQ